MVEIFKVKANVTPDYGLITIWISAYIVIDRNVVVVRSRRWLATTALYLRKYEPTQNIGQNIGSEVVMKLAG
jgi:hypothetical protein